MHVGARSGNHRSHGVVRKTADVAVKELAAAEDAAKAETETPPPTRLLPQQKRLESPHLCFFLIHWVSARRVTKKASATLVAMMAAVGLLIQDFVQFPRFQKVPTGVGAVTSGNGTIGFALLLVISGVLELV